MNIFVVVGLVIAVLFVLALAIAWIILSQKEKKTSEEKTSEEKPKNKDEPEIFPYHVNPKFITPAEKSFLHVLEETTNGQAAIFAKVNLGDLFHVEPEYWRTHRGKIAQKHVDFLICNPKTFEPMLAIELDDKSHNTAKARKTDEFKNNLYKAAGLPLLRIPVQHSYNGRELKQSMHQTITRQ